MKKFISLLLTFILICFGVSVSAESGTIVSSGSITSSGFVESTVIEPTLENTTMKEEKDSIVYTYYYGEGCSHCAQIDRYMNSLDGYNKLGVIKKEIYFNDENREEYLQTGKRLGFAEEQLGVPFLVVNENGEEVSYSGDTPIIEYFTQFLGEAPKEFNKGFILLIIGLLILIAPFVLLNRK